MRFRRHLHIAHRSLWYGSAVALVLVALLIGLVSQLLPWAERHPEHIAAWLSERADRPVAFDRVETRWTRRGPLLRLDNLRVGSGLQTVRIGDAEILVSQYAGWLPGHSFTELRLRGLDLTLERTGDGEWHVRGLPGQQQAGGDPFDALEGLGELQVIGGQLAILAPQLGINARVPHIDLRLRVNGPRVRAGLRASMVQGRSPLAAAFDFDRASGTGRGYAGAKEVDLALWAPLLKVAGVRAIGGHGQLQAWVELQQHRVTAITVDGALAKLRLRGAALPSQPASTGELAGFDRVRLRARWQRIADGWRLDAPELRFGARDDERVLDGLLLAGGQRYGMRARKIEAGPLFALLALSDQVPEGLRRWLRDTHPQASLREVTVAGRRGGRLRFDGRVDALGFAPVGNAPGLSGLAGDFAGDAQGLRFVFDSRKPLRFDWPRGFGVAHTATLHGEADAWREGAGWRVATHALRVAGPDFGARVRGGLWFQNDGTRPRIDIAADIDETRVPTAKAFWIHYLMPRAAVHWLDTALVGGSVQHGRAIVSGDLDDWPFEAHDGRFEASAHIANATLKFQPDWPAAEHLDGDVTFVGDGFTVAGKAVLGGVGVRRFDAGIARFSHPELAVHAEGGGDAARLLGLLKQSPLHADYADTLDNLGASGLAAVTFDLDLPLHEERAARLGGTVALAGARLSDKRWNLAFADVRGRAEYGGDGFAAERLAVVHDGQPGRLSLRAGGYVRDRRQAFEADLEGTLGAKAMLAHAPELGWLAPYVDGRSAWTASLSIPKSQPGTPASPGRLHLRSNLVGTRLGLPAPLQKPAATPLAAMVDTPLPLGSGEVQLALGDVLALRARSGARTGVRVVLGADRVTAPAPSSGLVATGHAGTLDALEWMAIARGGAGDGRAGEAGLALQRIDVSADRLRLVGGEFAQTRLTVEPTADGLAAQLQGRDLSGRLAIPEARGAPISGSFARVHWRDVPSAADGVAASRAAPGPDAGADIDPAQIPALAIEIEELRVRDAVLGRASLRTQPVAGGMRVEQAQARGGRHRIALRGDWSGKGAHARTRLDATIESDDFGDLLAGLGYGGQLARGAGTAKLGASWNGSPAAFSLATMEGSLALDARDGQLVELEPGAGRVLGLLSIAQLPRRLTLDFHDFFSRGFAFDRVHGEVRIADGRARSDGLAIEGPAADIRIHGSADLRAQQFDQTIEISPKTGNLLTVAGAIAGGPVGAAIGAAANAVLQKPLGRIGAKTYRVTGPWKDPKVEVISREQSRLSALRTQEDSG
jgi:uncharacterized protein (TIGR02099 family)